MYLSEEQKCCHELKHIVYVDDDKEDHTFFLEALSEINKQIKLTAFENGYDLIDFLESIDDPLQLPCSIICDMQMPQLDGLELLKLLKSRQKCNHIPVVIFSTSSATRDFHNSVDCGAIAFFSKPNSFAELKTAVGKILELCSKTISSRLQNSSTM